MRWFYGEILWCKHKKGLNGPLQNQIILFLNLTVIILVFSTSVPVHTGSGSTSHVFVCLLVWCKCFFIEPRGKHQRENKIAPSKSQMHKPNSNPLSIEVSELNKIRPVVFELTDRPEREARQCDFISAIWPDRCGRTTQGSSPQNIICFTHTHTHTSPHTHTHTRAHSLVMHREKQFAALKLKLEPLH